MKTNFQQSTPVRTFGNKLKMSGAVLLAAFAIGGLSSCENEDDEPIVDTVSEQDMNFAMSASQHTNAQISFGELALSNGEDDSVLEYARLLVDENTESKEELAAIADGKDVEISDGITSEMQAKYDELAALEGEEFDKAFINFQVDLLNDSMSMFENQIDNGENFTISGYAEKSLGIVKDHKAEALLVKAEIGIEDL
jgi:predicted outer membrane protein